MTPGGVKPKGNSPTLGRGGNNGKEDCKGDTGKRGEKMCEIRK